MSKGLERLNNKNLPCSNCKELKALEIIKSKKVFVEALIHMSLREYNDYCEYIWTIPILTQEEYDLLKEVLL